MTTPNNSPVQFTSDAAKRIANAVRKVEGQPQRLTGGQTPATIPSSDSFWAMIGGGDLQGVRYSWVRVHPNTLSDGTVTWEPDDASGGNAYESSGKMAPEGSVVRLHLAGFDPTGNPSYSFVAPGDATPRPVPVHNHADNFNGGLAFSVHGPGTSLPQQRWAL